MADPRQRAIAALDRAINARCQCADHRVGEALDALEEAGLRVVDAAEHDEVRATLEAVRAFVPEDEEQETYGAFPGGDPREFTPDPESSTDEERAAHKAACDAWNAGDKIEIRGGCGEVEVEPDTELATAVDEIRGGAAVATASRGHVRVQLQTFGLGTYTYRDGQVVEMRARIADAIRAMGGE